MRRSDDAQRRYPGHQWVGAALLETVRRLNGQCLEFLLELSRDPGHLTQFACLRNQLHRWAELDSEALRKAASCPVLLLDVRFQQQEWWDASEIPVRRHPSAITDKNSAFERAQPLMHEILTEAWMAARSLPRAATLAFGMTPAVTAAISSLRAADVHGLAIAALDVIRPRWDAHPYFWESLLIAACQQDERAMLRIHLQCLQLLGSEFDRKDHSRPPPTTRGHIK